MVDHERLIAEARRIYLRYATEVVEGLGFCPWAREAREQGRVAVEVIVGAELAPTDALPVLAGLSGQTDIGLLVFPEMTLDRMAFARFTAALREADGERLGRGHTAFALADFHPNAPAILDSPERLIPFIRRSPDPTIQCVRRSALDAVRLGDGGGTTFVDPATFAKGLEDLEASVEPLNRRVARANLRTVEREGLAAVEARLSDIRRDRDASYARLGLPLPPWSAGAADSV